MRRSDLTRSSSGTRSNAKTQPDAPPLRSGSFIGRRARLALSATCSPTPASSRKLRRARSPTDRGSQDPAQANWEALFRHGLVGSMGRRGNPYDNAKAESFMKTLKAEAVWPTKPSPMSPTTFRDSSTRSTTAAVSTPLWGISARNSSRTATPANGHIRSLISVRAKGPTPRGVKFLALTQFR